MTTTPEPRSPVKAEVAMSVEDFLTMQMALNLLDGFIAWANVLNDEAVTIDHTFLLTADEMDYVQDRK